MYLTSKVICRMDEREYRVEEESQLVGQALGEHGDGEDVDATLRRRRLVLVDEQRPREQEHADRRADARCQPLAHLASHFCKTKIMSFSIIIIIIKEGFLLIEW